ncbi:MAG: hypothetical protein KDJ86_01230 [Bauldia sp.]|uniref:hypothetical protein n=1 Tax=Bauldia sp. TaxID=2575872 RepID=UPI001DEC8D73|nr:hypothetical protein [Bauldia sp.]MCB1494381.1 hypothetical protein [Bauldia sp.]
MTFTKIQFGRAIVRAVALLSLVSMISVPGAIQASAASAFDGNWKIYIFGGQDNCKFGYRLPITISDGTVLYKGRKVHPTVIGVSSKGAVAINLGSGSNHVTGSGALAANRGSGRWVAPEFRCGGYWRAEKR